jgi:sigma-B regulation protein RsbU (phosphoserine phosphatase)
MTAHKAGGDYYDLIKLDDHNVVSYLGDVSGKGLPASLLMSNLQALIRGELPCHNSPGTLLKNVNEKLYKNTDAEKFATLYIGILDTNSHTFTYSNAGHEYPFLIHSDNNYSRLQRGGLPLGVMKNQKFEEETIELQSGDKLVSYSDGVTDSFNNEDHSFGEHRLAQLLTDQADRKGAELIDDIFNASMEHSSQSGLFDDMTAVVLSNTV